MANRSLKWEKTASWNLGIDFGLFNQRLSGSIDLYKAHTSDVLVWRTLPILTGYSGVYGNVGGIDNKGVEIELNSVNIKNKDFSWNSSFTFSLNRDKITDLYGDGSTQDLANGWFVGESMGTIYDFECLGIWQEEDLFNGTIMEGWYPGQQKFADLNGDGKIDAENDRKIIGNRNPAFRASLGNTFTYKNWSLYFLLNSIVGCGGYYKSANDHLELNGNALLANQFANNPYWTPENRSNTAKAIYTSSLYSTTSYQNRSFVRLYDVSLSYRFGKDIMSKIGLNTGSLQLFLSGKNLYTFTGWTGWDPEYTDSPLIRRLEFGLKLTL